jgi:hypothetical protein
VGHRGNKERSKVTSHGSEGPPHIGPPALSTPHLRNLSKSSPPHNRQPQLGGFMKFQYLKFEALRNRWITIE